jgi:hypothetical protein
VRVASYLFLRLELRGTPRLGRILALPVGCLVVAALVGGLSWSALGPDRLFRVAAVSAAIFAVLQFVRAHRQLLKQRRVADDWLRSATGGFVPPSYAWRAAQLCSPRERRMLARTLRGVEEMAYERPVGRRRPLYLPAVREHRESVDLLVQALERLDEPVTPAGMLRVGDLLADGASPLWGTTRDATLRDAISTTLAILATGTVDATRGNRAA